MRNSVPLLQNIPAVLDLDSLDRLLSVVRECSICPGHSDFPLLKEACTHESKNLLKGPRGEIVGFYRDGTLRHITCEVLVQKAGPVSLCPSCSQPGFRQSLGSRESHLRKKSDPNLESSKVQASSRTAIKHLSDAEKEQRLKNVSKAVHSLQHQLHRLRAKVDKLIREESVEVDADQHSLLTRLTTERQTEVQQMWPEGSPQRLLWEQQVKRSKVKGPSGMRWHPTVIRWCLSMYLKSPAGYQQLANSGFLHLPSQSTLKSYANFTESLPGVNPDILRTLIAEFKLPSAPEYQKNVCLVWDEMKVRSGLVITKGSGRVVGFTALDDVSRELEKLSELDSGCRKEPELASHITVFMVRGLMVHANVPFIWYPCLGMTADQLWGAVWYATRTLQYLGLRVRA